MSTAVIIVAAGKGLRAGAGQPKQWRSLAGRRVIDWTLAAFDGLGPIVVVTSADDPEADTALAAHPNVLRATGGADRAGSVQNGLAALNGYAPEKVLIHDAARPCVSQDVISEVILALDHHVAAAPALAVTDALWHGADGFVTGTQNRDGLFAAQTPQGFHYDVITKAHAAHPGGAADDVEVARDAGHRVAITRGDPNNLKITRAEDFARAEDRLRKTSRMPPDIRLGNGYDVHRFGEGDHVVLCGVKIPHERGLQGHSDADVGMHAVTDAIYGALAEGDIGRHFPPSDMQWKGADSSIFLRHAVELARAKGFQITNIDCTLVCEHPKVGPHAEAMRDRMAEIMQLDRDRISIKATTSERLGFTGRGEGIASISTAALVKA